MAQSEITAVQTADIKKRFFIKASSAADIVSIQA